MRLELFHNETWPSRGHVFVIISNQQYDKPIVANISTSETFRYSYGKIQSAADILSTADMIKDRRKPGLAELESLQTFIHNDFKGIGNIRAVYLFPHRDYIEVNTLLKSRDRRARKKLFTHQLRVHEAFPEMPLDFKVIFSKATIPPQDLPKDAVSVTF